MPFVCAPRFRPLILGVAALGCATAPAANPAGGSVELGRTMVELRAQNAGYLRQLEELQNRIFILEDKLDSRRMADEQRAAPVRPLSAYPKHAAARLAVARMAYVKGDEHALQPAVTLEVTAR